MKIYKHFDYATPFCMAENERELSEIMRLKYPKACSNFETAVEFFARMVEDVRKFEAWKVIGFSSFEEFCANELGKTLVEEQAKAASKASRIRKLAEERPEMTRAEIAREVGATRAQVTQVLTKPLLTKPLLTKKRLTRKQPIIRLTIAPHRTAANIHAKMGADYCDRLCTELKKQLHDLLETDFGCHPAAASNEGRES
jgi:hypothetical protein